MNSSNATGLAVPLPTLVVYGPVLYQYVGLLDVRHAPRSTMNLVESMPSNVCGWAGTLLGLRTTVGTGLVLVLNLFG